MPGSDASSGVEAGSPDATLDDGGIASGSDAALLDGSGDATGPGEAAAAPGGMDAEAGATDGASSDTGSADAPSAGDAATATPGDAASDGGDSGAPYTGACPVQSNFVLGVHVHFNVGWPASTIGNAGTGATDIWLLNSATSTGSGNLTFSATTQWCGVNLPAIALNGTGAAAACPTGMTCPTEVQMAFNDAEWDSKITRTFATTGSQTAWNTSDTLTTNPSLGLFGLTTASYGGSSPATWPAYCASNCAGGGNQGAFPTSDETDDDGDGFLGITANPLGNSSYVLPPTTVVTYAAPPLADQVYFVLRSEIQLTSVQMSSCTQGSGTAEIALFDNHVIGCHIASTSAACNSAQVSFLDQNRAIYGPDATHVASMAMPIMGTATVQQMAPGATCADVRVIP